MAVGDTTTMQNPATRAWRAMNEDRRLGAGLFAVGAGYLAAAFLISEPEGGYAAVGPRVFPIGIGIALVAVALRIAFRRNEAGAAAAPDAVRGALRRLRRRSRNEAGAAAAPDVSPVPADGSGDASATAAAQARAAGSGDTSATVTARAPADWRAAAPSALLFLAYVVLLEPVGYLPATTAFIAVESRLLGSRRWVRDVLAALAVTLSVYGLFSLLLGLRLPAGLLGGR